ncbi:MAG: 23S rRNA (uracil(1939)-C(5))-methyltransferase RlmD [Bacteroidales bacterium]|jgi:23S rRNA (uracil1939-C5)-methyltransferase|nr:23S rRNA (uracil(1939)-C(5))-methyltransferase RlmD [Bacteroidales bacterium]
MRKKNLPLIEALEIVDAGAEGMAVGRFNDMVVFVPWAAPGDVVKVQVTRKRKKYMEARLLEVIQPSPQRTRPWCSHFGICGGCRWQHLDYQWQLYYKAKWVKDALIRLGKFEMPEPEPILASPDIQYYRNKLEYTFSDRRYLHGHEKADDINIKQDGLGFHLPGRFDRILDIDYCYHQPEPSNAIRLALKDFALKNGIPFQNLKSHNGLLRNVIIRNNQEGEFMVIVVFSAKDNDNISKVMQFLKDSFPQIHSLYYVVNTKVNDTLYDLEPVLYSGQPFIYETLENLRFRIGPLSFFQTNTRQALRLYQVAREYAGLSGQELVYDLYTGTGTIACFVAPYARKVVGIEYVEAAVRDAEINARENNLRNVSFFSGDMASVLNDFFMELHGKPDVVITDPPRAGMHPDVVGQILKASPQRIVYVSCNPATQARDVSLLSENYRVERVQPVDMFPHTSHAENVMLLVHR